MSDLETCDAAKTCGAPQRSPSSNRTAVVCAHCTAHSAYVYESARKRRRASAHMMRSHAPPHRSAMRHAWGEQRNLRIRQNATLEFAAFQSPSRLPIAEQSQPNKRATETCWVSGTGKTTDKAYAVPLELERRVAAVRRERGGRWG